MRDLDIPQRLVGNLFHFRNPVGEKEEPDTRELTLQFLDSQCKVEGGGSLLHLAHIPVRALLEEFSSTPKQRLDVPLRNCFRRHVETALGNKEIQAFLIFGDAIAIDL